MSASAAGPTVMEQRFDPSKVKWTLLKEDDPAISDKKRNIFCAYNPTGEMHMLEKEVPVPKAGEVLLHVRATGICGSDIHFWKHGGIGDSKLHDECGAGHESAGEIIALGEGVEGWKVGDRVAIEAGIPCGLASCRFCLEGRYNQCRNMVFHSSPPFHGTLTRFLAHPAAWIHKLPDSVSFEEGSMVEPLIVALAGLDAVNVKIGDPVLICGAGPIGLMSLLSAHAAGCYPIIITDLVEGRLEFAKKLVPTVRTFLIERATEPKATAEKIQELARTPLKIALECTGFESSITTAIYSLDSNGKVCVIGVGSSEQKYPFVWCSWREIQLNFLFRYKHQYPKALRLIEGGLIDVKPLVSHRFALEKAVDAFHAAANPAERAIKVQILDV